MNATLPPILLTGVTGIIGRHVFYEILNENLHQDGKQPIIVWARSSRKRPALERIKEIVLHPMRPDYLAGLTWEQAARWISVIDAGLDETVETLRQKLEVFQPHMCTIIHMASTTNLSTLPETESEVFEQSYQPTLSLLKACSPWMKKFVFVSTAFSSGHRREVIDEKYLDRTVYHFRNYYEAFKNRAEKQVRQFCEKNKVQWQILRPGIVSGRLVDNPKFYTPKFNVFYAWAGVFAVLKAKGMDCEGLQIAGDGMGSVNITSCDYVAKAILRASRREDISELNIVHSKSLPNDFLIPTLLKSVGIHNFEFVPQVPQAPKSLPEKVYYKTAGLQFTPYLLTPRHRFDTRRLRELMVDIEEPRIDQHLVDLLQYALFKNFQDEAL